MQDDTKGRTGQQPQDAPSSDREAVDQVRQQQHTGSHDKPGKEASGSDRRRGTRAGAENVEPTKKA